jgi:alpha-tubulin suppressor-like RCC1 family protein
MFFVVGGGLVSTAIAACVGDEPIAAPVTSASDGGDEVTPTRDSSTSDALDASGPTVSSVAAGNSFGCAVLSDATVMCWGKNDLGQTGQTPAGDLLCGTNPCRTPTRVPGLTNVTQVAAGLASACAITVSHEVYCWGENAHDQLGHPKAMDGAPCPGGIPCSPAPKLVSAVTGAVEIAVGSTSACAIDSMGKVKCWGSNLAGQMGRGTHDTDNETPQTVPSFDTVVAKHIAASTGELGHYCVIKVDGTLWCWGRNSGGELGSPSASALPCNTVASSTDRCLPTPTQVKAGASAPFTTVNSVAASAGATCAAVVGGDVWCWGYDGYAVGGPPALPRMDRAPALAFQGLSAVGGSYSNVCALAAGSATKCWGTNPDGELGVSPAATPDSGCAGSEPCSFAIETVTAQRAESVAANRHVSYAITPEGRLFGWGLNSGGALGHVPTTGEGNGQCPFPCSPTPVEIPVP